MSTDPLFMRDQGGEYFWYHNDHLGTPQMMTTSSGAVVWKAKYTSFGKATIDPSSTVENPLRLAGQYEDAETGLHYNCWRYYSPDLGRFITADPLGFEAGDVNFYAYVWNDPLNWIDPRGLLVDVILDIGFIFYDIYELITDPCRFGENLIALGLDVAGTFIPFATGLGEGYRIGRSVRHVNIIDNACFAQGTLVRTDQGDVPIEEIKPGDWVLSRNEQTGDTAYKQVVQRFVTPDQPLLELTLEKANQENETFKTTPEHPFRVKDRGWVAARHLLPGDEIFSSSGGWLRVAGSTWLSERQTVYNLEVDGFHTYFVGELGAWVHNTCHVPHAPKRGMHVPAPKDLKGFSGLKRAKPKTPVQGGGGLRKRWKDRKGNIYEWDSQHGTIEKYNKNGRHLGEFDPNTGKQTKPAVSDRRVNP